MWNRYAILNRIQTLDPTKDYHRISFLSGSYDFPRDIEISLALAFFKTFAIPSIAQILDRTKQFENFGQKRYDDTAILLAEFLENGTDSPNGREAIRRINQIHKEYSISNQDFLYTLSTFVFEPVRWNLRFGWRRGSQKEKLANYHMWRNVGKLMNIQELPNDYDSFERWNREFEEKHFQRTPESERLGQATLHILAGRIPNIPGIRPLIFHALFSLMEAPLRDAMGFPKPNRIVEILTLLVFKTRAFLIRTVMPPRTKPYLVTKRKNPTYRNGYLIENLGPH
ncbi:DUF2236 domain-containing protein [Leptospira yasudae]|uniref:DUF2236 domain-containing protein n=1 Tax=Leptospira yasudae TaxID=2202201 RepID=A0ABX9LZ87_9LEPT|nr:oxygenase MpaB family protein [Leptospira yasudae]RHX78199.1 DUF2236 domain-containing protein [Leptospira yasudae]TGK24590.1 DUF2236 domain-containing protein [Leptospira yasudae]TGM05624.1 DUF2236 domain-containing protein [Leptospira yasudae]